MADPAGDRDAIRHVLATYSHNGDRGRIGALADCFTADGVLEYPGGAPVGPTQIEAALRAGAPDPRRSFVRHHVANPLITLDGDTAEAWSCFSVWSNNGPDHAGAYHDRLVRTPEGWRFAHRRVRIDWQSPDSLFRPLVTR